MFVGVFGGFQGVFWWVPVGFFWVLGVFRWVSVDFLVGFGGLGFLVGSCGSFAGLLGFVGGLFGGFSRPKLACSARFWGVGLWIQGGVWGVLVGLNAVWGFFGGVS